MSEQNKLRKRLKQLFAELQEITAAHPPAEQTLQGWTWACDARGIYTACSPEVQEVLGIAPEEFIGQPLTSFRLAPESQRYLKAVLERAAPHSEAILQFIHKSGQLLSLRMHILKQQGENGQENGWHGFVQTIQEEAASPEAMATLPPAQRLTRLSTDLPEGIAIEEDKLFPVQTPFSLAGELSLQQRRPVAQSGNGQAAASLAVPVQIQEDALALLEIIDDDPNRIWTEDEQRLVEEVANQLALALENARLLRETEARSEELALINRVVAQVASSLDLQENLEFIAAELLKFLPVDHVTIGLLNPSIEALELRVVCSHTANADHLIGKIAPLKNTAMETVIRQQRAVTVTDIPQDEVPEAIQPLLDALKARKHIMFPLMAGEEAIGTLGLHFGAESHDLNVDERRLIDAILTQISASIQNARLFQQVETRSTQLLTAAEVSHAASSILDPNPLIQQTVNLIRERFDLYYVGIFLVDEDGTWTGEPGEWAVLRAGTGEAGRIQVERGHRLKIGGSSMIGQCIASGEARISLQAPGEKQRFPNPYLPDTQSEIALPLISRGKVLGAMTIQSEQPGAFGQEDIHILQTMADQVANALQNASLFDQTQARAEELNILNELSLELSQTLDVEDIIELMYRYTSRLMDTTYFFVALYDEENELVSFPLVIENNERGQIPPMKKRRGLTQHVLDTKKPLLIHDNVEQVIAELGLETIIVGEPAQSWLGVPILLGERVFGVIATQNASRPRVFNEHHQELLLAIARQAAIAIQNARLFEQTERQLNNLRTVSEFSQSLARAPLTRDVIAEIICKIFVQTMHIPEASVSLVSDENTMTILADYYLSDDSQEAMLWENVQKEWSLDEYPASRRVVESGEPLIVHVDDPEADPAERNYLQENNMATLIILPMISKGNTIALLEMESETRLELTDEQLDLATTMANQAAVTLENALLFDRLQRQIENLSLIQRTTADLSAAVSLDGVVNVLLAHLKDATDCDSLSIFLYEGGDQLVRAGMMPLTDENAGLIGQPIDLADYPLTRSVIETRQPLAVTADDPRLQEHAREAFAAAGIGVSLTLPIVSGDEVLGTVSINRRKPAAPFDQEEITLLSTLVSQAAVAIQNAHLYDELRATAEELRELDQLKSQFLANMSHELRTPLNSIIGFSRVIMKGIDGPVTDQQMQDLSAIYSAGQHLLSMINDILDISKIEAGKMELAFEEIDLAQVINSVMSTARGLVKDKPVELITAIPEELPRLQADPTRVRQILLNLLSNAAKFTEEGSITVAVEESTTAAGQPAILVSVKDTGIGIPEEKQTDLFEPFTQVDGSLTRKTGGTGLGLSITRLLVELHGGEIGVESRPGEGSTFYFTLPLTPQRKRTVLAVEGDIQVAEMYQRYLAESEYQVIPVLDPNETLDMAIEYRPYAILLDTALTGADSFDILRTLKEDPQTSDIPVIVCSLREERERALALGAADYLSKPILSDDLRAALDRLSAD